MLVRINSFSKINFSLVVEVSEHASVSGIKSEANLVADSGSVSSSIQLIGNKL